MPLVTSTEMFKKAYDGGYAIGAFNVNNMEIVQGITEACQEEHAPVILQVSKAPAPTRTTPTSSSSWKLLSSAAPISPSCCTLTTARTSRPASPASTAASPPS